MKLSEMKEQCEDVIEMIKKMFDTEDCRVTFDFKLDKETSQRHGSKITIEIGDVLGNDGKWAPYKLQDDPMVHLKMYVCECIKKHAV